MASLVLYRKRFIPSECFELKDDIILYANEDEIITSWKAFRPKPNLSFGYSCYYPKQNIKVSKFYREDGSFSQWYCDIVDYTYDKDKNALYVTDLLADVVIRPDGSTRVLDIDEVVEAYDRKLIDYALLKKSLLALSKLLEEIDSNGVSRIGYPIEKYLNSQLK